MGARSLEGRGVSKVRVFGEGILMAAGTALAIAGPVHCAITNIESVQPQPTIASSTIDTPIRPIAHTVQTELQDPPKAESTASVIFDLALIPAGYIVIYAGAHRRVRKFFASLPPAEKT